MLFVEALRPRPADTETFTRFNEAMGKLSLDDRKAIYAMFKYALRRN